jgi:hypothetical protein
MRFDPITAAVREARDDPCPRLQVANGIFADKLPTPDPAVADAVKAAWLPVRTGQAVPMIGEPVAESCLND